MHDRFTAVLRTCIDNVTIGQPSTFAVLERSGLENIATHFTIAIFEHSNDFMMTAAIRAEDTHAPTLTQGWSQGEWADVWSRYIQVKPHKTKRPRSVRTEGA